MNATTLPSCISEAVSYIKERIDVSPKIAVILTGGLAGLINKIENKTVLKAEEIPHCPHPTAEGHSGRYIFGKLHGVAVAVLKGRCHYYEGFSPLEITFPIYVLKELGVDYLINLNSVGSINQSFETGDIMLITDHINFMGVNPLRGITNLKAQNQFPDMTNAYDVELQEIAHNTARQLGISLKEGVYIATMGPSYETKAEIKAFRVLGADAVGMSTVPAVITANFLKMKVLALSCITNPAADIHPGNMNHEEVLEAIRKLEPKIEKLVIELVREINKIPKQHG